MRLPFATGFTEEAARFQWRLLAVLALVVLATSAAVLALARRSIAREEEHRRETEFQVSLALLRSEQRSRHALLVARCRALATKARIQAALEDGAEDLLYLSARDELRDLLADPVEPVVAGRSRARFYRFLDAGGRLIAPTSGAAAGALAAGEERGLSLTSLPDEPQVGYRLLRAAGEAELLHELVVVPILSNTDGRKLAALVLGFPPLRPDGAAGGTVFANGIWFEGRLHLQTAGPAAGLARRLGPWLDSGTAPADRLRVSTEDGDWLVFAQRIETGAGGTPAYEICAFPLGEMMARQRVLGWRVLGSGVGVMLLGLGLSYFLSFRLSAPVEQLAHDSREQRARRAQAEAALETTSAELDRAARFSANASHQLKTPVAVLRAGLEMLHARGTLGEAEAHEIAVLIHQTYRLSSVIEDLLLLSRMDAGQLRLNFAAVDLSDLVAAVLDDLSATPAADDIAVEQDCPPGLRIAGEKRYTALILQNLLENARKYNRPGGRIRVAARAQGATVRLTVGNTTLRPIAPEAREHIFERFHRGGHGETIPGYGLGLNLSRELARNHLGELELVCADADWVEFAVTFRVAEGGAA
ncbi:MAG TPA: HAMP domain-containing sensor histidine kinase [Opitutaceae bacterium]|nr:HAMP domain-containing sensor histidine kinase [Opitutaceae bacterium]